MTSAAATDPPGALFTGGQFKHPMGAGQVKLYPGDKIYQHKQNKLSFMIEHPAGMDHTDGQFTAVLKNGKPMKASPYAVAVFKTNYELVHTVPGTSQIIPMPGTWFPIKSSADVEKAVKKAKARLYGIYGLQDLDKLRPDIEKDANTLLAATKYQYETTGDNYYLKQAVIQFEAALRLLLQLAHARSLYSTDLAKAGSKMTALHAKFNNPLKYFGYDFPLDAGAMYKISKAEYDNLVVQEKIKALGFDLKTGTEDQFKQYAMNNGMPFVEGLTYELGMLWVKADLNHPDYKNPHTAKIEIEKAAKHISAVRKFKALAEESAKQIAPGELPGSGQVKNSSITYNPTAVSSYKAALKELVLEASGGQSTVLGSLKPSQLNAYLKAHGGNYVGKMVQEKKQMWIRWHVAGFPTATYMLEQAAVDQSTNTSVHVAAGSNPGSPFSAEGKKAWQALSDKIVALPNGVKLLKALQQVPPDSVLHSFTHSDLQNLVLGLNLQPFVAGVLFGDLDPSSIDAVSVPSLRQAVRAFWHLHCAHLPPASPVASNTAVKVGEAPKSGSVSAVRAAILELASASNEAPIYGAASAVANTANIGPMSDYISAIGVSTSTPIKFKLLGLREILARLYMWVKQTTFMVNGDYVQLPSDVKGFAQEFQKQIPLSVESNEAFAVPPAVWKYGSVQAFELPVGLKVYVEQQSGYGSLHLVINPEFKLGYKIEPKSSGGSKAYGIGTGSVASVLDNSNWTVVFEAKAPLNLQQAQKQFKGITQYYWKLVEEAETKSYGELTLPMMDEYTVADSAIVVKSLSASFPAITDDVAALPDGLKKLVHYAAAADKLPILQLISWKIENGHYEVDPATQFPSDSPVGKVLQMGFAKASQFYNGLPDQAYTYGETLPTVHSVAKQLGVKHKGDWQQTAYEAWDVLQSKLAGESFKPSSNELVLTKTSKTLGGMHSKSVWADAEGQQWMVKAFNSDPNAAARIDAEHAANMIGRLHGFRSPETRVMTLEGKYSYVQFLKPAKSDLTNLGYAHLTETQLADAMAEHVLDWVISNHDSNFQNIMIDTEDRIFGIDKGQAFRFFPQDKFDWGYLPETNPIAVWYDQFYEALAHGKIKQAQADKVALFVLTRAAHVQTRQNKRHKEILELAFAHRMNWPKQFPTKAKFIAGLMDRKANVLSATEKLYKKLYKAGGLKWTIDTEALLSSQLTEHIHVAVSESFVADVKKAGTHGKALMLDSRDVEDAHVLVYTEIDKHGKLVLRGELSLLEDADAVVTQWLNQQLIVDKTGDYKASPYESNDDEDDNYYEPEDEEEPDPSYLPGSKEWFMALVMYAKTVNSHVADGEYNKSTVAQAAQVVKNMTEALSQVLLWEKSYVKNASDVVFGGPWIYSGEFLTPEQQSEWKKMVEQYLDHFDKVKQAHEAKSKIKVMFPDMPLFTPYSYTPSPESLEKKPPAPVSAAPPVYKWSSPTSPVSILELSDGTIVMESKLDDPAQTLTEVVTPGYAFSQVKLLGLVKMSAISFETSPVTEPTPNGSVEAPEGAAEAQVTSGSGKVLKVFKRKSTGTFGQFDPATGQLKHKQGDMNDPYKGYEYDVESDSGALVEYRSWTTSLVPLSQKGLMRFTVENWNGSKDAIEDVLDIIQTMGVAFSQADEQSLELFYWRHLYGILRDRMDRSQTPWVKTVKHVKDQFKKQPEMAPAVELEMWRQAWSFSIGKSAVEKAQYMPQFGHGIPKLAKDGFTSGKPYWVRPDHSLAQLKKNYGSSLPVHNVYDFTHRITKIVQSGGIFSTEERVRLLGTWYGGMSSSSDQKKGSANFLFTRQNHSSLHEGNVYLHPSVFLRTSNYAFDGDHFGNIGDRKSSSPFDLSEVSKMSVGSNEMLIKNGVSVLDGFAAIFFQNSDTRNATIKVLHQAGVTHLHGIPIEELFVTSVSAAQKALDKVWAAALTAEKEKK